MTSYNMCNIISLYATLSNVWPYIYYSQLQSLSFIPYYYYYYYYTRICRIVILLRYSVTVCTMHYIITFIYIRFTSVALLFFFFLLSIRNNIRILQCTFSVIVAIPSMHNITLLLISRVMSVRPAHRNVPARFDDRIFFPLKLFAFIFLVLVFCFFFFLI